jgi:hypothetical protein
MNMSASTVLDKERAHEVVGVAVSILVLLYPCARRAPSVILLALATSLAITTSSVATIATPIGLLPRLLLPLRLLLLLLLPLLLRQLLLLGFCFCPSTWAISASRGRVAPDARQRLSEGAAFPNGASHPRRRWWSR